MDVFTPCVDDAYVFGQIAAANSVSDIYAMGGRPLTALSIIAFPIETLSPRVMNRMLQGGIDKLREAGTVVVGGHSIKDKEIKFGFAVTGVVHPGEDHHQRRRPAGRRADPDQAHRAPGRSASPPRSGRRRPKWPSDDRPVHEPSSTGRRPRS